MRQLNAVLKAEVENGYLIKLFAVDSTIIDARDRYKLADATVPFIESLTFSVIKPGYHFKNGKQGLGYYLDTRTTLQKKEALVVQRSQALRSVSRRTNIVESCMNELAQIWKEKTPRQNYLSSIFEKITATNIDTNTNTTHQSALQILNDGYGLSLDMYEDRIEHWRHHWTEENINECPCCSEYVTCDQIGKDYLIKNEKDERLAALAKLRNNNVKLELEQREQREGETKDNTKLRNTKKKSQSPMTSCNHGKDMCVSCLKDYFRFQMGDDALQPPLNGLRCPKNCGHLVADKSIQVLMGEEEFKPLATKMRARRITSRPHLRFCPNIGCGMEIAIVGTPIVVLFKDKWHSVVVRYVFDFLLLIL